MGLWRYGKQFIDASRVLLDSTGKLTVSVPAYYLLCHGIELTLKAYLRGAGRQLRDLKGLGHDLVKCYNEAKEEGVDRYCMLEEKHIVAIRLVNTYYATKELEYISAGYKEFPEFSLLAEAGQMLVSCLKQYCYERRSKLNEQ